MVRALLDFMLQEVIELLMLSLDWTVALKWMALILVLRLCAQVLGCLSLVILIVLLLLI